MVDIVSRSDWGAVPPRSSSQIPTPTAELWLHHSAGNERGAAGVRAIQRFHMERRGWTDIAYSFLIDRVSLEVFEGRGAGVQGGHTFGRNRISHGLCVMGNFEVSSASSGLVSTVAALVRHGHQQGWWPATLTGGHRDVRPTACPGANLYQEIGEINRQAVVDDEEDEVTLKKGANGAAVKKFQEGIKGWNANALPVFGADGDFGTETETWVSNFQSAQDLGQTGAIDGITGALILEYRSDEVS